jgi:tetratricopeptide (TPR) repeat protein
MARVLEALGRTKDAADAWARAIERADPADPGDFLQCARLQEKASARDALATLDSAAVPLGPLPALQAEAVSVARRAGLHEEALLRVDELLRAAPRRETWLAERGRILVDAGRRPEAWAAFSEALAELQALPLPQRNTAAIRALEQELHGHLRSSIGEDVQ